MAHTYIKLPPHGGLDHFTYIAIASYICWKRGFVFLSPEGFASKHRCPGIPDIYVKYQVKFKDGRGTRRIDRYAVIEIETNATKESIEKKVAQFTSAAQNLEPIIIPMNKFEAWRQRERDNGRELASDIDWIHEFIGLYIPENEKQ